CGVSQLQPCRGDAAEPPQGACEGDPGLREIERDASLLEQSQRFCEPYARDSSVSLALGDARLREAQRRARVEILRLCVPLRKRGELDRVAEASLANEGLRQVAVDDHQDSPAALERRRQRNPQLVLGLS